MRLKYSSKTPTFYQNDLAMRNTTDVKGGDAVNPLVAFYDISGRGRGAIPLFSPNTTRDNYAIITEIPFLKCLHPYKCIFV
jgi:hypothetical protein